MSFICKQSALVCLKMLLLVLVEGLHLAQFGISSPDSHMQVIGEDLYLMARVSGATPSVSPDTSRSSTWEGASSKSVTCGTGDSSHLSIDWDAVESSKVSLQLKSSKLGPHVAPHKATELLPSGQYGDDEQQVCMAAGY